MMGLAKLHYPAKTRRHVCDLLNGKTTLQFAWYGLLVKPGSWSFPFLMPEQELGCQDNLHLYIFTSNAW
jgi:hypothetical protein